MLVVFGGFSSLFVSHVYVISTGSYVIKLPHGASDLTRYLFRTSCSTSAQSVLPRIDIRRLLAQILAWVSDVPLLRLYLIPCRNLYLSQYQTVPQSISPSVPQLRPLFRTSDYLVDLIYALVQTLASTSVRTSVCTSAQI